MKLFKYGLPFAALAMLASCSNDNIDAPANSVVDDNAAFEGMYVSFNVANPTAPQGRATGEYTNGFADEYAVHDVWLYLYRTAADDPTPETTAQLYYCGQLAASQLTAGSEGAAITGDLDATFQLKDMKESDLDTYDYYAFVVLNKPSSVAQGKVLNATEEGEKFTELTGKTLNATQHAPVSVSSSNLSYESSPAAVNDMMIVADGKYYFTMCNAPLFDGEDVTTLVKLENDNFAKSPKQAEDEAATVYVQRGVAKVVLEETADTKHEVVIALDDDDDDETLETVRVKITGWSLDVVSAKSYFVQRVANPADSEPDWSADWFKSSVGTEGDHILWSIDPFYSTQLGGTDATVGDNFLALAAANNFDYNEIGQVEYCLENTMDFNCMQKSQTTRIVFQTEFMLDGETASSFIMYPGSDMAMPVTDNMLKNSNAVGGEYEISALFNEESVSAVLTGIKAANGNEKVLYYPDGVSYYTALIRHFTETDGQEEIEFKDTQDWSSIKSAPYTKDHLGRYGVVRNNVYNCSVGKVFGYGLPTPPTPTDVPDDQPDDVKYNIQLVIKVIAWTKRDNSGMIIK